MTQARFLSLVGLRLRAFGAKLMHRVRCTLVILITEATRETLLRQSVLCNVFIRVYINTSYGMHGMRQTEAK